MDLSKEFDSVSHDLPITKHNDTLIFYSLILLYYIAHFNINSMIFYCMLYYSISLDAR